VQIKTLNREIRDFFHNKTSKTVYKTVIPGNTHSLWKAVKIVKSVNVSHHRKTFYENNQEILIDSLPGKFNSYFDEKNKSLLQDVKPEKNVCIGSRKIKSRKQYVHD
jgi:hypothetical protein